MKEKDNVPRVYPQRVLDLIENELYEELENLDEIDEEAALNAIEDKQREQENEAMEREEEKLQRQSNRPLTVPGVTFDGVADLDNLPSLKNGACTASKNGLDNLPSIPPLFGGRRWPFM
ncbi:hypothetical protein HYW94_02360 [Candidatus Uhrbacteria bacterium]|nr:hypothetical protein [Candidatus Uhrbacteria bacterium]